MYKPIAILLVILALPSAAFAQERKKLIEFGWDEPSTAFMRSHVAEMEKTPFDGCVFDLHYLKNGKADGAFLSEAFGKRRFTQAELQNAIDDLQAAHFQQFTENFFRFNVQPGDIDWFDDFGPIVSNARLAAHVAHEGRCRGILFDIEMYGNHLFKYRAQRDAETKSWQEYAKQTRKRGAEIMRAMQEAYPGITVFLSYGYTMPRQTYPEPEPAKLSLMSYGLFAPFLDGMLDAAAKGTRLIDGCEFSYGYQTQAQFDEGRRWFKTECDPYIGNLPSYREHFSQAFALWIDFESRQRGWNTVDLSKNYFTPAKLEAATKLALKTSDEYVWIYTEKPWWRSEKKFVDQLPKPYIQALRNARASIQP